MIKTFLKNWTLPIAICLGALAYIVYSHLSFLDATRPYAAPTVAIVQPLLIFSMLFLSFCKIDVRQLRPRLSHLWLLLIQCGSFILMCLILHFFPNIKGAVYIESALLCTICPTATSATVVTQKLKGDGADIAMYTLLINLCVAIAVPIFIPMACPNANINFYNSLLQILFKVFPLLIGPLLVAQIVRYFFRSLHQWLLQFHDLAFYLWAVALSIAISVTVRSIAHADYSLYALMGIAFVSLACCILQFALGRYIGRHYHRCISTSQSLGQKNTVFAIWMGYTFMNPITSIAGGFYSVWHNLYNTYQLRQMKKRDEASSRG